MNSYSTSVLGLRENSSIVPLYPTPILMSKCLEESLKSSLQTMKDSCSEARLDRTRMMDGESDIRFAFVSLLSRSHISMTVLNAQAKSNIGIIIKLEPDSVSL